MKDRKDKEVKSTLTEPEMDVLRHLATANKTHGEALEAFLRMAKLGLLSAHYKSLVTRRDILDHRLETLRFQQELLNALSEAGLEKVAPLMARVADAELETRRQATASDKDLRAAALSICKHHGLTKRASDVFVFLCLTDQSVVVWDDLMCSLTMARNTIKKVLEELEQNGLITRGNERTKGKGVFLAPQFRTQFSRLK